MIIQLTDFTNKKPVYMEASHFVAMHTIGTATPHTYIIMANESLQVAESTDEVLKLLEGTVIHNMVDLWAQDEEIIAAVNRYREVPEAKYMLFVRKDY